DWTRPWQGWHLKENIDRQIILKRLAALRESERSKNIGDNPDVYLEAGYGTNNWELNGQDAFKKGRLGQDSDEWSIALSISMPWGNDAAKAELEKVRAQKMMLERYQQNWSEVLLQ